MLYQNFFNIGGKKQYLLVNIKEFSTFDFSMLAYRLDENLTLTWQFENPLTNPYDYWEKKCAFKSDLVKLIPTSSVLLSNHQMSGLK